MLFTLELHPLCGAKCFMTPAIHVWCKKFARGRENVDEEHPGHAASNQQPTSFFHQAFTSLLRDGEMLKAVWKMG